MSEQGRVWNKRATLEVSQGAAAQNQTGWPNERPCGLVFSATVLAHGFFGLINRMDTARFREMGTRFTSMLRLQRRTVRGWMADAIPTDRQNRNLWIRLSRIALQRWKCDRTKHGRGGGLHAAPRGPWLIIQRPLAWRRDDDGHP
jgi:hypothetical protein